MKIAIQTSKSTSRIRRIEEHIDKLLDRLDAHYPDDTEAWQITTGIADLARAHRDLEEPAR